MSPEIEFLGERKIKLTTMSESVDAHHNTSLRLAFDPDGMSSDKENSDPKRLRPQSKYLCSPYEINKRGVIQPNILKLYNAITTLCDVKVINDKWAINIDNCKVSLSQLGKSMKPGGWMDSWVINAFCRMLFKENHPRKSNKHYVFHTAAEYFLEKYPNDYVKKKWNENVINGFHGAGSARALHLSERIHKLYFPSLYEKHWFIFAVDLKARKFVFLDSFYSKESSYQRDDCRIFTMKLMELWCPRYPENASFSSNDIPNFCVHLTIDSMFHEKNNAHEVQDLIQNFNPKDYKSN